MSIAFNYEGWKTEDLRTVASPDSFALAKYGSKIDGNNVLRRRFKVTVIS